MTKAMALAPASWEANFSRGFYAFYFEPDWRAAEPHFQKAIAINPRSSLAQSYYAIFLSIERRAEEAIAHTTIACQLDPLSPLIHGAAATVLNGLGLFDGAERSARQALELQPDYLFGLWQRGVALSGLGRHEEAIQVLEHAVALSRAPIFVGILGLGYGRAGRSEDAARLLRELEDRGSRGEYIPAFTLLTIHAGLGDIHEIRRALAAAAAESTPPLTLRASIGPYLDAFRNDSEINRMLFELYGK
jgi:tetratricopeptide (TPR) repeat protein